MNGHLLIFCPCELGAPRELRESFPSGDTQAYVCEMNEYGKKFCGLRWKFKLALRLFTQSIMGVSGLLEMALF